MIDPSKVRFSGPLASHRNGLWAELLVQGYSLLSSVNLVRLMANLSRWLEAQRLGPQDLDSRCIKEFLEHRRASGYTHWLSLQGLDPVLRHLRCIGVAPAPEPAVTASTPLEVMLDNYEHYLLRERGLLPSSVRGYRSVARKFISTHFGTEALELQRLNAGDVTSFVLQASRSGSVSCAKQNVAGLRSLLRYLHVRGDLSNELASAVPAVACRRLVGLPKGLAPSEVRKLLLGCDRCTHIGRRDFVALLLMVRLGLRSGEVAALRLDDLDWTQGALVVRGKRRREDRLPLPQDIGEAIVSYLKRGRPRSTSRQLFLGLRAPHDGLRCPAVARIVRRAGKRIGLLSLHPHCLRHTAAMQMLRNGASLPSIGEVLRHQHFDTTAIYAKVDRSRLREVARPWPGGTR